MFYSVPIFCVRVIFERNDSLVLASCEAGVTDISYDPKLYSLKRFQHRM
jgi:hypothetical protein